MNVLNTTSSTISLLVSPESFCEPPVELQYVLPRPALAYIKKWKSNKLPSGDWYTSNEVDMLAREVIRDHNESAQLGERFVPRKHYRIEQAIFASKLPSKQFVSFGDPFQYAVEIEVNSCESGSLKIGG